MAPAIMGPVFCPVLPLYGNTSRQIRDWGGGALSRLKQYPYDVTEGFVLIASVAALSSPGASRGREKKKMLQRDQREEESGGWTPNRTLLL